MVVDGHFQTGCIFIPKNVSIFFDNLGQSLASQAKRDFFSRAIGIVTAYTVLAVEVSRGVIEYLYVHTPLLD